MFILVLTFILNLILLLIVFLNNFSNNLNLLKVTFIIEKEIDVVQFQILWMMV
jgi:hypothetical protein